MKALALVLLLTLAHEDTQRSTSAVNAFRATHPCPSTGLTTGHCPGYVVDHKYPLCAGGADTPENMMWQEIYQSYVKDRIERELCACKAQLVPHTQP